MKLFKALDRMLLGGGTSRLLRRSAYMLLPGLLLLLVAFCGSLYLRYTLMIEEVGEDLHEHLDEASKRLQAKGISSSIVAQWLADALEAGLYQDPSQAALLCKQVLDGVPSFSRVYAIFRDPSSANLAEDKVVSFKRDYSMGGSIVETSSLGAPKDLLVYRNLWQSSQGSQKSTSSAFSYYKFDEDRLLIGDMRPVILDNVFLGAVGVTQQLLGLERLFEDSPRIASAEYMLMNKDGRVLAEAVGKEGWRLPVNASRINKIGGTRLNLEIASTKELSGRNGQLELHLREYLSSHVGIYEDPLLGKKYFITTSSLPALEWVLYMVVPYRDEVAPILWSLFIEVVLYAAVFVALLLGIIFSLRMLSRSFAHEVDGLGRLLEKGHVSALELDRWKHSLIWLKPQENSISSLVSYRFEAERFRNDLLFDFEKSIDLQVSEQGAVVSMGDSLGGLIKGIEEIVVRSDALSEAMGVLSRNANDAVSDVKVGQDELVHVQSMMQSLTGATRSISQRLTTMSEKASNIGKVVETITKIADYTHLLSLNAAMEAEKAGEYGSGFAVVAQEIRRLADQISFATMDIERMVQEVQVAVATSIIDVDKYTEEVRRSVHEVNHLSGQFASMLNGVLALGPRFESARSSVKTQFSDAHQVHEAVLQLNQDAERAREFGHGLRDLMLHMKEILTEIRRRDFSS